MVWQADMLTDHLGGCRDGDGRAIHPPWEDSAQVWPASSHSHSWISDVNFFWFAPRICVSRAVYCSDKIFICYFFMSFIFFKRYWTLPKNTWVELTTVLILFGSSLVEHRYQKRQGFALLKMTWEGIISLSRLCSDVIIFPSSLDILMEEQIPEKIEFVKALDLNQ